MATQTTGGGSTTSLTNTPQAKDDYFYALEDSVYCFDVMANDLGGTAKTLWSIDTTSDDGALDLVSQDVAGVADYSELGAKIQLTTDGKILYDTRTSSAIASLAAGETSVDQFTYAIRLSNGTLSWATVNVTVTGTNDGPDISVGVGDSASANRFETDSGLVASGTLTVTDIDTSDTVDVTVTNLAVSGTGGDGGIDNATLLAMLILTGNVDNAADGTPGSLHWAFDSGSEAFDYLADGQTLILTYTLSGDDGHGGTDTQAVTITITGTNDEPVLDAITSGSYTDTAADDSFSAISGTLTSTDPDQVDTATYGISGGSADNSLTGYDQSLTNALGKLYLDSSTGAYTFIPDEAAIEGLDDGDTPVVSFTLTVTDALGASDSETLTINLTGANDDPELGAVTDASINDTNADDVFADVTGTLTWTDRDASDTPHYSVTGGVATAEVGFDEQVATAYGTLYLNETTGAYKFVADNAAIQALDDGESHDLDFSVSVSDGTTSDSDTLTITVNGANDDPESANGSGSTDEDTPLSSTLPAATDRDGETVTYSLDTDAAHGGVLVNPDGTFTYIPDSNYHGPDSFTFTVSDGDASNTYTYDVTVNSVNDAPELTGSQATLTDGTEDIAYVVSAADLLTGFTDVDGDVLAVSNLTADHGNVVDNGDGTFTITPDGNYNGTVVLSYNVIDGNGGSVAGSLSFDLAAVNDPAVIGGDDSGEVTEDAVPNTVSGTLTATDVDNPPNTFIAVNSPTASANGYGTFIMTADGVWTYTLDNSNAMVNALVAGAFLMDSFTVQAADGTTQLVSITINGADDVIVVTPPSTYDGLDAANDHDSDLGVGSSSNPLLPGATNGDDTLDGRTTGSGADTINALAGNDTVNAGDGGDIVYGGDGSDHIYGGLGNDTLYGQAGNDFLYGESNNDQLYGGSGDDYLDGGDNSDMVLNGGSGNDTILGGNNNDIIIGGYGADTLTGGAGDDTFAYQSVLDTNDTILDFMVSGNDQIDLSAIDADPSTVLNDAFGWGGATPTAHDVWMSESGGNTTLYADTDGNPATAEFMVTLQGFTGFDPATQPVDVTF